MMILKLIQAKTLAEQLGICFAPADDAGGGDQGGADDQGGDDKGDADDKGADGKGGADDQGGDDGKGGADDHGGGDDKGGGNDKPWYEAREWTDPALQEQLIKAGYHKGTPEEALEKVLKNEAALTQRLGKPIDQIMDKPAEDQALSDYFKANAETFKVPDNVDGYEVTLPDDMPEGLEIDDDMMAAWKVRGLEKSYPQDVIQSGAEFFAEYMKDQFVSAAADVTQLEEKLNTSLQGEWGADWKSNKDLATRSFQALAAKMKLDPDQTKLIAGRLNDDMGDAGLLKFFHGIGVLMGEDGLIPPRDSNAPALDLANAQQRKAKIIEAHTGDIALARGDTKKIKGLQKELDGLNTIIAQHG